MSKRKQKQKDKQPRTAAERPAPQPVTTKRPAAPRGKASNEPRRPLTFGPETYKWLGIGFALVLVGLFLMAGARNPDPNVFDTGDMYGFRRITLAPLVILSGIGVTMYAILKK